MLVEDASGFRGEADEIVTPHSEAEVIAFLRRASDTATPVTIAGAGTGVTGGRVPLSGALLSLEKLNRLEIRPGIAVAGPGVLLADLHAAAAATGQFYPPDPTETSASMGGTIATNASGSRSFRYGDTRRHVLRLRVVLMNGRVLDVRRGDAVDFPVPAIPIPQTTKHTGGYRLSPGMDWIDLFVGSEGTSGSGYRSRACACCPARRNFWRASSSLPMTPGPSTRWTSGGRRRRRACSSTSTGPRSTCCARASRRFPSAGAAILFEEESADLDVWHNRLIAAGALLDDSWFATTAADRERFRRFRHALPELVNAVVRRNGFMKLGSDYAVPIARNREMMAEYRRRLERRIYLRDLRPHRRRACAREHSARFPGAILARPGADAGICPVCGGAGRDGVGRAWLGQAQKRLCWNCSTPAIRSKR